MKKLKNGMKNSFNSTPSFSLLLLKKYAMNKTVTTLFCMLAFIFSYACSNTDLISPNTTTHKVTFNPNTPSTSSATVSNLPPEQNVIEGKLATKPATPPTLNGYTFVGWYTEASTTTPFQFSTKITKATTLYAKWTTRQTFTITYHANKPSDAPSDVTVTGVPENPVNISEGQTPTAPTTPTLAGYNFVAWYTEATATNPYDFSQVITANIDLYAKWNIQQFTITYHGNKPQDVTVNVTGVPDIVNIDYNQTITVPTPPTLADYNFVGWYTEATTTSLFDFSQVITANIDLYAKWSQDPVVTFDTQRGSTIESQTITASVTKATRPQENPTREDYTFDNWYTTAETGTTPFNFDQDITAQSTTVYARWNRIILTVTYHANKPDTVPDETTVSNVPAIANVNSGDMAAPPATPPVLQDYDFQGWFAGTTTGTTPILQDTAFVFETTAIKENKDLYAKWTRKEITITFYGNKPDTAPTDISITGLTTDPTIVTVNSGETTTALTPPPELTGYMLDGWFIGTISGGTLALQDTAFDFTQPVRSENINLYAKWLQKLTVTYHGNKPQGVTATITGVPENPVSVSKGKAATAPTPPTLTDYNFVAWYTEATATNQFDFSQVITTSIDLYAKWSQDPVVTFDTQGGSNVLSQTITAPTTMATRPDNPARIDYAFDNWYTMANGGDVFDFTRTITASITVYAQWNRIMLTVTYHGNKPDTVPEGVSITNLPDPATVNVDSGDTATEPATPPVLQDYVFQGWFAGTISGGTLALQDTAFAFETTAIKENKDLYAKWTRKEITVTFYGNKPDTAPTDVSITGLTTDPTIVTVNSGETTTALKPAPGLTGYTLDGWFIGTISGGTLTLQDTAFDFTQPVRSENINLYAKWTKDPVVTFDTQGGSNVLSQTITTPTTMATRPDPAPTREGYAFVNWYTMATGGTLFDFTRTITASITVYAQWKQQFTVTYHANKPSDAPTGVNVTGVSTIPITVNSGDRFEAPTGPILTGYNFVGWYTEASATNQFDFSQGTTANIDLYAKWTKGFVVTFDTQGGNNIESETITGSVTMATRPDDPVREDYTFDNWYTMANGGDVFDFTRTITASITAYAQWNRIMLTVTYHGNEPDNLPAGVSITNLPDPATVNVDSGDTATEPATPPVLQDYVFQGWFAGTISGGTLVLQDTAFAFETTVIKENKDLYAKWTRKEITITFYGNKPSTAPEDVSITGLTTDPTIVTVNSGDRTTAITPTPQLTGYTLDGWFIGTISGGTPALQDTAFDFTTTIRGENINLYAKWTKDPVVTFDTQGGSNVLSQTITAPTTMAARPDVNPTRNGYAFDNWYTMATGGTLFDFTRTITASITVYAQWKQQFTVTYHANKPSGAQDATVTGVSTTPVTVNNGDRTSTPTDPTLTGYYFEGWYTEATATNQFSFSQGITENIDLYAKWTQDPVVIFDTRGGSPIDPQRLTGTIKRATRPDDPAREDYTFDNWYTTADTGTTLFNFDQDITALSTTVYARWNRIMLTVTYHGNEPDNLPAGVSITNLPDPATVNVDSGDRTSAPTATPVLQDYVFQGWFAGTISGGTLTLQDTAFAFESAAIKENKDLYAKWTRKEITISFYGNKPENAPADASITGLTTDPTIVTVNSGETTTALNPPPGLTGYTLDGWFIGTTSGGTLTLQDSAFDFTTTIRGENINLYAKWSEHPVVTFDTQGGSDIASQTIAYPITRAARPDPAPRRQGYAFDNWYTLAAGGDVFDFTRTITASITIYARWIQQFTVTYHANKPSGTPPDATVTGVSTTPVIVNSGDTITAPNDPTLTGYTFVAWSWYTEETAINVFSFSTTISANIDLYAKWVFRPSTKAELLAEINRAITPTTPSPNLNYIDTSLIRDMSELFSGKRTFNGNISSWNVAGVTNMYNMFRIAHAFNQDLSSWNVSKVTNMEGMFSATNTFNGNISSWNVSQVKNMSNMFDSARAFNQNISSWNVSLVENMYRMFRLASAFNQNISSWNVSKVENMEEMFNTTNAFNGDISNWNVSLVQYMSSMFQSAVAFNQNISSWNVSQVQNMSSMFESAHAFNQNISSWNVSKVTNMIQMFEDAKAFNGDISSWNVAKVSNMQRMFRKASAFNQNISSWNVSIVTNMNRMFSEATAFNQNLSSWNVAMVTKMGDMFFRASAFNGDISSWNVAKVTEMSYMFAEAGRFNQNISSWNVSKVTDMSFMFSYASAFRMNIDSWNVASSVNKREAFAGSGLGIASNLPTWAR